MSPPLQRLTESLQDFSGLTLFASPLMLLLLIAVPALFILEVTARSAGVMSISTGDTLARIGSVRGGLARIVPPFLRALALVFLIIALARPLEGLAATKDRANVIDIMLCVDVSGSMKVKDFVMGGQQSNRLDVTKQAVRDFIESRKQRAEDRFGLDRLGLVLYAAYAWTQCPLTLDYAIVERELRAAEIDETDPRKQGTAIGSAIGLALSRLRDSEAETKLIILLTDGLSNAGELDPITAAKLAADYGVRIYTIGAGSTREVIVPDPIPRRQTVPIDEDSLRRIAEITGGKFYRAKDTESLLQAYGEINQLETTEIEVGDYYQYKEGFPKYAALGIALMAGAIFSRRFWFDPIP